MKDERFPRRLRRPGMLLVAAVLVVAMSPAAWAKGTAVSVKLHGPCSASSNWSLKIQLGKPLVVTFAVTGAPAGESWNVFVSDNGTGVYVGTRTTNSKGTFVVSHKVRNLVGLDTITVGANTSATGETCAAKLAA